MWNRFRDLVQERAVRDRQRGHRRCMPLAKQDTDQWNGVVRGLAAEELVLASATVSA
jgi:hypothetical protein